MAAVSLLVVFVLAVLGPAPLPVKAGNIKGPLFPLQGCSDDWREFRGHCYKLVSRAPEGNDMATSVAICKQEGPFIGVDTAIAYLADIYSQEENDFVAEVVAARNRAWIGMVKGSNGPFYWMTRDASTGSEITDESFTYWKLNEPSNTGGDEECVEINRGTTPGRWNDLLCRRKRPAVCKYEIALVGVKV